MSKIPTKKMKFRLNIVVLGLLAACFLILIGRIVYIACFAEVDGVKYGVKAYNQQLGVDTISANRGTIYDCNMNVLAKSATVWTVSVAPNQIDSEEQRAEIASCLSSILGVDYNEVYEKTGKNSQYEIIKKKVEKPQADAINEYCQQNDLSGIHMTEDSKRYYPLGNTASHTIGFVGSDNQGLLGIELSYDDVLTGEPGKVMVAQDPFGDTMPFDYEYYYGAQDGNSLVLSIDLTLQNYCDSVLKEMMEVRKPANRALAMMMNVNTGEIVALSIQPDFNLNDPYTITDPNLLATLQGLDGDALKTATADARTKMWTNKAVSETYEPGSVFKVVTASAALEEGTQTMQSQYNCTGSYQVEDRTFHCWKRAGHGHEDFTEAVVNSCNPAFIQIGQSLGPELFFRYFNAYGMTEKTGIDLPGEANSLYVAEDDLTPVSLASESFGQTMSITPIQMMTAFCACVNGGYMITPHVVKQVVDQDGNIVETVDTEVKRQVISQQTCENMRYILERVVSDNGGSNASVPGYKIAGKSGTAQKLARLPEKVYVASFIGAIPADDPQYALMVLVDEPTDGTYYGGVVASPVFAQIMSQAAPYLGITPEYTEEELANMATPVPAVEGLSVDDAKAKLSQSQFANIEVIGSGATVTQQVPPTGSSVSSSATIYLYTDNQQASQVTVPNVCNMTQAQVNNVLVSSGLNLSFSNSGVQNSKAKSVSQSPAAGEVVPRGSVVTVQFLTNDETG